MEKNNKFLIEAIELDKLWAERGILDELKGKFLESQRLGESIEEFKERISE
jgi:hypothetical protein